jgi:hypothetical protein
MKRTLLAVLAVVLAAAGTGLFLSGLAPFIRDFAALRAETDDLLPRIARMLAGVALLGSVRWVLALLNAPDE